MYLTGVACPHRACSDIPVGLKEGRVPTLITRPHCLHISLGIARQVFFIGGKANDYAFYNIAFWSSSSLCSFGAYVSVQRTTFLRRQYHAPKKLLPCHFTEFDNPREKQTTFMHVYYLKHLPLKTIKICTVQQQQKKVGMYSCVAAF